MHEASGRNMGRSSVFPIVLPVATASEAIDRLGTKRREWPRTYRQTNPVPWLGMRFPLDPMRHPVIRRTFRFAVSAPNPAGSRYGKGNPPAEAIP